MSTESSLAGIVAFQNARLDEDEARVYQEGTPPNGVIAWLTYHEPDGSMGYTTVAHGDTTDGLWIADGRELASPASVLVVHDPARVLREVEAGRGRLALMIEAAAELDRLRADDGAPTADVAQAFGRSRAATVAVKWDAMVHIAHPDYMPEWKP